MATVKQIHWFGEVAGETLFLGLLYAGFRILSGPGPYKPGIAMPAALRIGLVVVLVLLSASARTYFHYRKAEKR